MDEIKLKPCPFCGVRRRISSTQTTHVAQRMDGNLASSVLTACMWNRRADNG